MEFSSNIKNAILNSSNVCMLSHVSIDGDGLGSCFALGLALKAAGKNVVVAVEEEIPQAYKWLPGNELVASYDEIKQQFDTAIVIDAGDEERIGSRIALLQQSQTTINIDHHITNMNYAQYNHVDSSASAAGEIIYFLLNDMCMEITKDIATDIYVAIMTDTGSFNHSNTSATCHMVVADLFKYGLDVSYISQMVNENISIERLKFTAEAINSVELHYDGQLVLCFATKQTINKVGAKDEDCEGIIDLIRKLQGTEVAAFLRENDDGFIRVNLRSKNRVNVAKVAAVFAGGGHERAAGCTIKNSMKAAKHVLIEEIGRQLSTHPKPER